MSRTPVPFAPETLESIRRAFRLAADRRHDLVGLEHLLYALIEDPQARQLLNSCSVDLAAARSRSRRSAEQVVLAGARKEGRQARIDHRLRPRRRTRRRARGLIERAAGGQRRAARVPAAGGRQPCVVFPPEAGRRSPDAAADHLARRPAGSDDDRTPRRAGRGAGPARSARGVRHAISSSAPRRGRSIR